MHSTTTILRTDAMVRAVANRGKDYTVFFRGRDPILVQVNFRSRHGSGEEYNGYRRLWSKGDERLSTTAHCAINAAKKQYLCQRCRGDGHYFRVPDGFNPFNAGAMATAAASEKVQCFECRGTGFAAAYRVEQPATADT